MKESLIRELNKKINEYNAKYNLFCGGCCFAAYTLANALTNLGIKYRTIIYQSLDIINTKNFNAAINGNGVSHVAIEVSYKGKNLVIGDCSGIIRYFEFTGYPYKVRRYRNVTPDEILSGYINNNWNILYDKKKNVPLKKVIDQIAEKYESSLF